MDAHLLSFAEFLTEFQKENENLTEFRAERVWRRAVSDADEAGQLVPGHVMQEMMSKCPGLTPDRLASDEVLLERYKTSCVRALEFTIESKIEEHIKLVKKLNYKRVRFNPELERPIRHNLEQLTIELCSLREELTNLNGRNIQGGPLSLVKVRERRAMAIEKYAQQQKIVS